MNSTDKKWQVINELVKKLYQQNTALEKEYFPTNIDNGAESYYESPKFPQYQYASFINTNDEISLKNYFADFFESTNLPEFSAKADLLAQLAFELKNIDSNESAELNPFIYTLY